MREPKKKNSRGFKISQYAFATFMGLLAAKLAPSHTPLPPEAHVFVIPDQLPTPFYQWWNRKDTYRVWQNDSSLSSRVPWIRYEIGPHATWQTLTRDHFRCKGKGARAPLALEDGNYLFDCWGFEHGLPWIQEKEFVEPLLLRVLNAIQQELQTSVLILSGHRCPAHHRFITHGKGSPSDRHLIAAAADFQVRGFEKTPLMVVSTVQKIFNKLSQDPKTKFHSIPEGGWKNGFCELFWRPAGQFISPDHPDNEGYFELILTHRLDLTAIKFVPKESYRLPLF
jgi:hypothetical protein